MSEADGQSSGTPLRFAISGGEGYRVRNVELLLINGADINANIDRSPRELTALTKACKVREFEIVLLLLRRGADYNKGQRKSDTFIFAIQSRRPEHFEIYDDRYGEKWCTAVWDWLLAQGVDPDKAKWVGDKWVWE